MTLGHDALNPTVLSVQLLALSVRCNEWTCTDAHWIAGGSNVSAALAEDNTLDPAVSL